MTYRWLVGFCGKLSFGVVGKAFSLDHMYEVPENAKKVSTFALFIVQHHFDCPLIFS